jgi:hypothetical protein
MRVYPRSFVFCSVNDLVVLRSSRFVRAGISFIHITALGMVRGTLSPMLLLRRHIFRLRLRFQW